MTTIRVANFGDITTIHAMTQAAYAEYRTILPHSSVWQETPELIAAEMQLGSILVCIMNGKIVASVRCHIKQEFVYVHRLVVLPTHRRQGLGSLLMQAVEELACKLNLYQVRLELRVAQPENRHFYQKLGYQLAEISAYLPDGKPRSYWMSKNLRR